MPLISVISVLSVLTLVFYRLYLHPLRHIPGPRLAALTGLYGAYHDIALRGALVKHLHKLHTIYGPVLRYGPNQVHFSSPSAYTEIFAPTSRVTKDPTLYLTFGASEASFTMIDPAKAKARREVIGGMFSRRTVVGAQGVVLKHVERLCDAMAAAGGPVDLSRAFGCHGMDTTMDYAFSEDFGALDLPKFRHPILVQRTEMSEAFWLLKYFPIIGLVMVLPAWVQRAVLPALTPVIEMRDVMGERVRNHMVSPVAYKPTLLLHRLSDPSAKGGAVSKQSMEDEAQNMFFAGIDTMMSVLGVGMYHILATDGVEERLLKELVGVWPEVKAPPPSYEVLERLPYLTAVIKESLRLGHGVVGPVPRVTPPGGMTISNTFIPAGTVVSIDGPSVHLNPDLFPDPDTFLPGRWLDGSALDRYLVAFGRGSRACIGQNLAWCELYFSFAILVRRLKMRLYKTTAQDMEWKDYFTPVLVGTLEATVEPRAE